MTCLSTKERCFYNRPTSGMDQQRQITAGPMSHLIVWRSKSPSPNYEIRNPFMLTLVCPLRQLGQNETQQVHLSSRRRASSLGSGRRNLFRDNEAPVQDKCESDEPWCRFFAGALICKSSGRRGRDKPSKCREQYYEFPGNSDFRRQR